MVETITPDTEEDLRDIIADALARETPLDIIGGGSKSLLGRQTPQKLRVSLSLLSDITLYEPEELVMTAGAGASLAKINELLTRHGQHLAFEPPDWRALLGEEESGAQTIGGVIACNLSGPRRLAAGAARDHFLGVRAVSGRGEVFKSGGRVVKNVTGYDMCKLLAGSYGTLAAMAEVTFKVLPVGEKLRSLLMFGLDDAAAVKALGDALQSPFEISAAAHLPRHMAAASGVGYVRDAGASVTAIRIEGHGPSVDARLASLRELLGGSGEIEELHRHNSAALWREIGNADYFAGPGDRDRAIWRLSVPPASAAGTVAAIIGQMDARAFYDWGGGLIWVSVAERDDAGQDAIRAAIAPQGGHATLIRAGAPIRARADVFHPQPAGLAALSARIKDSFDPAGILNPGRMYAEPRL
ncbi:MAG: glycolate oxidase subunit GlcE [Rhodospirillales bacterium]|nr:glycolate oxidase subunit GlcE [Rhodospirillales bacterium]